MVCGARPTQKTDWTQLAFPPQSWAGMFHLVSDPLESPASHSHPLPQSRCDPLEGIHTHTNMCQKISMPVKNNFCSWLIKKHEQWMPKLSLRLSFILRHKPSDRICLLFHLYCCSLCIQSSNRAGAISHVFVIQLKILQTCFLPY